MQEPLSLTNFTTEGLSPWTRLEIGASFFKNGRLDIKSLNFGVTTLVPKTNEANNIKICLLYVDGKENGPLAHLVWIWCLMINMTIWTNSIC
jgi:hypothetical protein